MFSSKKFLRYFTTFFLSLAIQSIFFFLHKNGYGTIFYKEQLNYLFIIINSLAAVSMQYCLTKNETNNTSFYIILIFAISYGLCSYALIQQKTISQAIIFTLFPILYLFFKDMYTQNSFYKYSILLAVFMSLNMITSMGIISILFILLIVSTFFNHKQQLSHIIYFLFSSIISFALSAFFSLPQLYDLNVANKEITYSGFQEYHSLSVILSRLLFGSVSSTAFIENNGINLYFGMFPLLCLCLYFISKNITRKEKIFVIVSICACIITFNYSPILYLVSIKSSSVNQYNPVCFVFSFFLLLISFKGATYIKDFEKKSLILALFSFMVFSCLTLLITKQNFSPLSIMTCIIISIIYALICFSSRNKEGFHQLLLLICIVELSANAFLSSFAEFIPTTVSNNSVLSNINFNYLTQTTKPSDTVDITPDESTNNESAYNSYIEQYYDADMHTNLEKLELYCTYALNMDTSAYSDPKEKFNDLFQAVGFNTELFIDSPSASITFESTPNYQIIDQGHNVFHLIGTPRPQNLELIYAKYTLQLPDTDIYILNNNDDSVLHFKPSDNNCSGYINLPLSPYYGFNFHVNICTLNESAYSQLVSFISAAKISTNTNTSMTPYYWGLPISSVSLFIFILLILMRKKGIFNWDLNQKIETFQNSKVFRFIISWIKQNKIYIIAFAFPFCCFVLYMVLFNISPFGTATLWDGDGALSVFPYLYDASKQMQTGHFIFSPNQGYGNGLFALPLYYYVIALFIKADHFLTAYHFILALLMGCASVSMVFYIRNRHCTNSKQLGSNCYWVLLPAFVYSLSSYMFTMHAYFMWLILIAFLPILIWSLEQLLYSKKAFLYILLLSLFMCTEIQLSYYICIFLCLVFLFADHKNIKDFFLSGLRFSLCSILAACNSYIYISGMFASKTQSGYTSLDSVKPSFGFFGSYFDIFMHHMPFTNLESVSQDNTNIALYVSILCVILAILYIFNRSVPLKNRIKRLLPIILLYFTFNEQISAYIINGFHYQTLVPNRHAFLVIFLLAVTGYDGLLYLSKNSLFEINLVLSLCTILFVLCAVFSSQISKISIIATFVSLIIYAGILVIGKKRNLKKAQNLFVILCGIIMFTNGLYTTSQYNLYGMNLFGNYQEIEDYIDKNLNLATNNYRVNFTASPLANTGMVYGVSSTDLFQSCISNDILNYHSLYGGTTGTNFVRNTYASTPVNNSLFSIKYIFYPTSSTVEEKDLDSYKYLTCKNNYYILENTHAAPLLYTVPLSTKDFTFINYSPIDVNEMVKEIQPEYDDVYQLSLISYNDKNTEMPNSYSYYSSMDQPITPDEATTLLNTTIDPTVRSEDYYVRIYITPTESGYAYFYAGEYIPLGYLNKGQNYSFDIYGPKLIEPEKYIFFTINEKSANHLYTYLDTHQLSDVKIQNNIISGISDIDTECYTQIMMPYNSNWKAYIDGSEVPIETNSSSIMYIKTPSGRHSIEIKYTYSLSGSYIITIIGWIITFIFGLLTFIHKKKDILQ